MMNWFEGNVVEAIQLSKNRKSIFLVCIKGNMLYVDITVLDVPYQ